jgi:hypothetical protein
LEIFNKLKESNEEKKRQGIHDYSLINALLKKTDEVHLHSNFIYSMINPKGSHYHEGKFLELFLDSINESDFIDIDNACVYKEKGKIDLLVEDGEHYLIIENKLRAVDQKHQLSRYIDYVIKNYLDGDNEHAHQKIRVVYLSEYKAEPSIKSESIIGLELKDGLLTRNAESISALILPTKNTKIKFNRVKHSNELWKWVEESKKYLEDKANSKMLIYAFEEYRLILERLKNNNWRNIMSLDEYVLNKIDKKDEKKMYDFMQESVHGLNNYRAKKIYRSISELLLENSKEDISQKIKFIKKDFTEANCIQWFNRKGDKNNWRDVGFIFEYNKKEYILLLGVDYIYLHKYGANLDKNKRYRRDEIFCVIDRIKSMEKLCG